MRRLWTYRHLVASLVRRQYQVRYRQSAVGLLWAVVPPLASLGAATLVFDRVVRVDTGGVPYTLFAFAAITPWTFFASALSAGITSISSSQVMIQRLAFPRAALPLSVVGTALVDLGLSGAMFVVFVYATGAGLPLTALWFPALFLIELVLVAGLVLLGSALNVFARDIRLGIPMIMQLWLFLTPVMYPLSGVPEHLRPWYLANPMTGLIESFRRVLVYGQAPDPSQLVPALLGALAALIVGIWYFASTESRFADVI